LIEGVERKKHGAGRTAPDLFDNLIFTN